jgi:hypothetical protein
LAPPTLRHPVIWIAQEGHFPSYRTNSRDSCAICPKGLRGFLRSALAKHPSSGRAPACLDSRYPRFGGDRRGASILSRAARDSARGRRAMPQAASPVRTAVDRSWAILRSGGESRRGCARSLYPGPPSTILARGPFDVEQNLAHLALAEAEVLVTRESGREGGFPQKREAARQWGCRLVVVARSEVSADCVC